MVGDPDGGWSATVPGRPQSAVSGGSDAVSSAVIVDPTDMSFDIYTSTGGGRVFRYGNGGASCQDIGVSLRSSPDIPCLADTVESCFSVASLDVEPVTPNALTVSYGIGVWTVDTATLTPGSNNKRVSDSRGIENLVSRNGAYTSEGFVVAVDDHTAVLITDPDSYPATQTLGLQGSLSAIANGPSVATPGNDLTCVAALGYNVEGGNHPGDPTYPDYSGYSADGGQTRDHFGSLTGTTHPRPLPAGNSALSARAQGETVAQTNLVRLPQNDCAPRHSLGNGDAWQQSASFARFDERDPGAIQFGFQQSLFNS